MYEYDVFTTGVEVGLMEELRACARVRAALRCTKFSAHARCARVCACARTHVRTNGRIVHVHRTCVHSLVHTRTGYICTYIYIYLYRSIIYVLPVCSSRATMYTMHCNSIAFYVHRTYLYKYINVVGVQLGLM